MQEDTDTTNESDSFAIVAVGASAGGLEAFTQLLRALPNNTGMAFVFIQHLDPKHRSILAELLAKATGMPVLEAKDGTTIEPNHVFVIPPNVNMGILEHRLHLTPRGAPSQPHTPIDFFMRSLAEAKKKQSIGVVLSGTASDGTRGLVAIKAEGGITFAQDEPSAGFSGMPHSAIASGCVDFALPPKKIGQELARISGHPYLNGELTHPKTEKIKKASARDEGFDRIFNLLQKPSGIDFREYKPGTVQRRTLRRMALHDIRNVSDYTTFLEKHPQEVENLVQDLLIPVTSFFRDSGAFESLKSRIFPAILKDKATNGNIRIWAPGCSTGEEAYSLAIVLLEFLRDKASSIEIQVFGTDVNERGIEKARAGIYPENVSNEISAERLRRFFTKADEGYRVSKAVRDVCIFAKQNVAEDPPFSQMNLVVCRNLLIYLAPELQKRVIPILHYALRPSGFLMLGSSESVATFPNLFRALDKKHKLFAKKLVRTRLHYDFSAHRYPRETQTDASAVKETQTSVDLNRQHEADRIVLTNYAPPGVIINDDMEILQFRGSIGPYLEPAPGRATLQLLKIARREFVPELRAAVIQAKKNRVKVKRKAVEFTRFGQNQLISISVEPLGPATAPTCQYLILFERTSPAVSSGTKTIRNLRGLGRTGKKEITNLRHRLAIAEEQVRSAIESKEASDEEFQSVNEEILSANEELQSTNEELETSKEEVQSGNEELNTVNDELRNRNRDLDRLNNDLQNVLASTTLPVVMVDRSLRIRRVTTASEKILKVLPSDIGRSITDLKPAVNVVHLEQIIAGVIETLTPKELEVQSDNGHWYSLSVRPYRTADDKIDGAVIVLSDIDALKQVNVLLEKSKEFTQGIINTVREPLIVLGSDLNVLYTNPSFLKAFRVSREETEGRAFYELGNEQWNIPKLRLALDEVLTKSIPLHDFEVEHDFPAVGMKTMLLNARKIESIRERPLMLLAIEDVTERKHMQRILLHSQDEERRRISRNLHDSIGQYLAHAKMTLAALKRTDGTEKEAKDFSHLMEILDKCLTETRTISHLLHPPLLDELGLLATLKWYVDEFSKRSGIHVNLNIPGELKRLPGDVELALFRILQESLTNIHRHSHSKSVDILLELGTDEVTLQVKDDGQGMPPESLEPFKVNGAGGGLGLRSMRERTSDLGGRFEIQSDKNGTLIRVTAPVSDAAKKSEMATGNPSAR